MHGVHVPPEYSGQPVHDPEPVALFHVPVGHTTHGPPSGPVKPALHVHTLDALQPLQDAPELEAHATQVTADVAPVAVEYFAAAQSAHVALPVTVLYLPATQAVHGPDPSGPEKPTLHVQAATAEEPIVVEYMPAVQSAHAALPVAALYLPAAQAVHVPPSGPV